MVTLCLLKCKLNIRGKQRAAAEQTKPDMKGYENNAKHMEIQQPLASLAELAEHPLSKREVVGSPTGGFFAATAAFLFMQHHARIVHNYSS